MRILAILFFCAAALLGAAHGKAQELNVLQGRWVRTDRGYVINFMGVNPAGKMLASYANP